MEMALVLILLALGGCAVGFAVKARRDLLLSRRLNRLLEKKSEHLAAELKAAQTEVRTQMARAASAQKARTDFLASMSHELRTPLNAVVGFSDLLLVNEGADPLSHRQRQALEEIRRGGLRLTTLVDEVLGLIEIEAGRTIVTEERVDPVLLVRQVCEELKPAADAAHVELKPPPHVAGLLARGDRQRLKQVLTAVTHNAIQYNRTGGSVLIEARQSADRIEIFVHDTGHGLPSDRMAEVFEPFNRLGRETLDVPGTGIGLAMACRLIEAMGGRLTVESEEGLGASFMISLVAAAPSAAPVVASPVPRRPIPQATVLYVEDNPSNIALMKHVITAIGGLDLHVAETGLQGLALARDLQPDVIILDINLPGMDGYQVKARLDDEPLTRGLPVLALSARASKADLKRGREAGFQYLTKPLDIGLLVEALFHALPAAPEGPAEPTSQKRKGEGRDEDVV